MSELAKPLGITTVEGATSPEQYVQAMIQGANAPTRLSASDLFEGYDPRWVERVEEVRFNGKRDEEVIRFDLREGWVERYAKDEAGEFVWEGDELKIERVHGHVAVDYRIEP